MDAELFALMFKVYRGYRVDIDAEVDALTNFNPVGNPAGNAAAKAGLQALAPTIPAKRSDEGLRAAQAAMAAL